MPISIEVIHYDLDFKNSTVEFRDDCYTITADAIKDTEVCDRKSKFFLFV